MVGHEHVGGVGVDVLAPLDRHFHESEPAEHTAPQRLGIETPPSAGTESRAYDCGESCDDGPDDNDWAENKYLINAVEYKHDLMYGVKGGYCGTKLTKNPIIVSLFRNK